MGAISADKSVKVTVSDRELEWNDVDTQNLWDGWQAATPDLDPFLTEELTQACREVMDEPLPGEAPRLLRHARR